MVVRTARRPHVRHWYHSVRRRSWARGRRLERQRQTGLISRRGFTSMVGTDPNLLLRRIAIVRVLTFPCHRFLSYQTSPRRWRARSQKYFNRAERNWHSATTGLPQTCLLPPSLLPPMTFTPIFIEAWPIWEQAI